MTKLECALEEKDRELREVSIRRSEFMQQLDMIRNMLSSTQLRTGFTDLCEEVSIRSTKSKKGEPKAKAEGSKDKPTMLDKLKPDKLEFLGGNSYRTRMILMNRIDIYRLFITVMIISSKIKYPRILTKIEERELKMFIDELAEFENMLLNLDINENVVWEKGKVVEKQILQLFTKFFNA